LGAGPLVLAVSALLAHKNVGAVVEALPEIRRAVPGATVVVPANPTPLGEELVARARALAVEAGFVLPGWVSSADLEGLYAAARCFVFPSLREGFGLPVLEAMRRGVPVACSNGSAVPEVAGGAALLFDPLRPAELAGAVTTLLRDRGLADELAARGRARAAEFTWRRAAEETLASFEHARRAR
jgi:glycosyltransferase involved in cell wall biosynthesis